MLSRTLNSNHPFMVLASDGVWEFLPSQSVIDMVSSENTAWSFPVCNAINTPLDDLGILIRPDKASNMLYYAHSSYMCHRCCVYLMCRSHTYRSPNSTTHMKHLFLTFRAHVWLVTIIGGVILDFSIMYVSYVPHVSTPTGLQMFCMYFMCILCAVCCMYFMCISCAVFCVYFMCVLCAVPTPTGLQIRRPT